MSRCSAAIKAASPEQRRVVLGSLLAVALVSSSQAFATLTLPITGILCDFFNLMTGQVGYAISGIIVVILGIMWAAGEVSGWVGRGLAVIVGISIALQAATWLGAIQTDGGGTGSGCSGA
ncbi:TrbC/VirB2 family protein [Burkholderia cepacia]|uniref:TrbC/VirB2 family protein n=1 Tax=Burkholderia cepacia TaxID=292 RepID=UPI0026DF9BD3|nr:TrbC/VirB2 family protein [Burkholderia cepacia]MDO5948174.1 TrbC/VirB2 family protein [Burkholderia cepacia]